MARIAGIDLPKNKRMEIALTYIYGIGRATALKILEESGIDRGMSSDKLTEVDVAKIVRPLIAHTKLKVICVEISV